MFDGQVNKEEEIEKVVEEKPEDTENIPGEFLGMSAPDKTNRKATMINVRMKNSTAMAATKARTQALVASPRITNRRR
jgi:hypothetical protein